jgi:23S rRNA (adenine-C8)-methyltransferase
LANPHTFTALDLLTTPGYGGFSPRRITVSTVGFAPNLRRLAKEHPQVTVTLSVHSPFAEQRAELIPLERRFPLSENLAILDEHVVATRRKAYLAYLLIGGVNDSAEHLEELARLVKSRTRPELFHVSVIRYNAASGADASFRPPASHRVSEFVSALNARGVHATRRQQFGSSISAACGQLHARSLLRTRRSS